MPDRAEKTLRAVAATTATAREAVAAFWGNGIQPSAEVFVYPQTFEGADWRLGYDAARGSTGDEDTYMFAALCALVGSGVFPRALWGALPRAAALGIVERMAGKSPHLRAAAVESSPYKIALWQPRGSAAMSALIAEKDPVAASAARGDLEPGARTASSPRARARLTWYYRPPNLHSWYAIAVETVTAATPAEAVWRRCAQIEAALAPFPVAFILGRRPRPRREFSLEKPVTLYDPDSEPYTIDPDDL